MFIVTNSQLFNDCYIFDDNFYSRLNAKVMQIAFMNMKPMIFCSEFIQEFFTKIFEATALFWKLNNEYPNTKIF